MSSIPGPSYVDSYKILEASVAVPLFRFHEEGESLAHGKEKFQQVMRALERLALALVQKYSIRKEHLAIIPLPKLSLDDRQLQVLSLSSIEEMLDAKIRQKVSVQEKDSLLSDEFKECLSLRGALNLARKNPCNVFGLSWGTLWGKAKALSETLEAIKEQRRENL